jgi:hypothetical protein
MAGKKRELTPAQTIALTEVRARRDEYHRERESMERRIREQMQQEISLKRAVYALAIRRAKNLGVPQIRIREDGMLTSDYATYKKWLTQTEAVDSTLDYFSVEGNAVRVNYPDFKSAAYGHFEDYPNPLTGLVRADSTAPSGWVVVEDPQEEVDENGAILEGWLTVEIRDAAPNDPVSLPAMLTAWATSESA